MWLVGFAVLAAVLLGTVVAMGGRIESATWGLVVAAGALVFALHSLYRMATVLSRPAVEVVLEQDDVASLAGVRELREERRRVLRAINELQFDYEMGKLSDEDYEAVRQGYQLRAVEVMRALDVQPTLHPALENVLRKRGMLETGAAGSEDGSEDGAGVEDDAPSEAEAEAKASSDVEPAVATKASSDVGSDALTKASSASEDESSDAERVEDEEMRA